MNLFENIFKVIRPYFETMYNVLTRILTDLGKTILLRSGIELVNNFEQIVALQQ